MNSIKNHTVSVVLSVYNSGFYLREAINSILTQTFTDFEFLIVDDGSTDDSLEIIRSYSDKRIILIQNKNNLGLATSLNKAIRLAKGKYIARMDADDIAMPFRLYKQVMFMEKNIHLDLSGSWVKVFGAVKNVVWRYPALNDEIKAQIIFNSAFAHPSVIYRRDIFLKKGLLYDESVKRGQDYELWSRVIKSCKVGNIQEVLLLYRIHYKQIGKVHQSGQADTAKTIRLKLLKELDCNVSDMQYNVHENLSYYKSSDISTASNWLVKLVEANKESKYCDEKIFNKVMLERFWATYSSKIRLFNGSLGLFIKSPIQRYALLDSKTYLKHFVKLIIGFFKNVK